MKEILKSIFIGVVIGLSILLLVYVATPKVQAEEKTRILSYQFNKQVVINISNLGCPFKHYKNEFPYGAVAMRVDGKVLPGCYKKLDENLIRIQWVGGDFTDLPANAFLITPEGKLVLPEVEATL